MGEMIAGLTIFIYIFEIKNYIYFCFFISIGYKFVSHLHLGQIMSIIVPIPIYTLSTYLYYKIEQR